MAQREWESTSKLIDAAIGILRRQWPMTIRQLFYALVSAVIIENCLRDYKRVSRAMTIARHDDRVDFDWIVDRSRPTYNADTWSNLAQVGNYMERTLKSYRRDRWQDQPAHCSLICEKDALTGSLEPVREEYGLTLRALRGFDSTTGVREVADEFVAAGQDGKGVVALYLGDWDPSGECMERELRDRIVAAMCKVLEMPENASHPLLDIEMRRVAIFKDDIAKFNLPPLKVKNTDSRAKKFKRKHGNMAVELDALPANELRDRLRGVIETLIDHRAWDRAGVVEEAQRATCQRYAGLLRELGQR
jgi:hypothetical protein